MGIIINILTGLSLCGACGLRIFIPFFVLSFAYNYCGVDPVISTEWIFSNTSLVIFLSAAILEIIGYYNSWIDNMLDLISAPLSLIAGTLMMSFFINELNAFYKFAISILLGGGAALYVQLLSVKARLNSSVFKSGFGNKIFSTIENITSIAVTLLALYFLPLSLLLLISIVLIIYLKIVKQKKPLQH